jgi:hypothetical protein
MVSVHGQLEPCFWAYGEVEHHGRRVRGSKAFYLIATVCKKERKEARAKYSL